MTTPILHDYGNGSQPEQRLTVEHALNVFTNTIYNQPTKTPAERDQIYQQYCQDIITRMFELDSTHKQRPEILQFAIYTLVSIFVRKWKTKMSQIQEVCIDLLVDVYDRLNLQVPQFRLKDLVIGLCTTRNSLLVPYLPQPS